MKKIYTLLLLAVTTIGFTACEKSHGFYIGKSISYDDFLWCRFDWNKIQLPEQTLDLEVGELAFKKPITLQVVYKQDKDPNYKPVNKVITVLQGGKDLRDGIITINKKNDAIHLQFRFTKTGVRDIHSARYKLSLCVLDPGDLDLINGQKAKKGAIIDTDVLWDVKYEKIMNPLAKGLMWIGICFLTLVIVWFAFLKRAFFPTFSVGTMQILYTEAGEKKGATMLTLRKARKIVCTKNPNIQSGFKEFLCGRIIYEKNDFWENTVEMVPMKAEGIAVSELIDATSTPKFRIPIFNITESNGPKRPYDIKLAQTDKMARISIG